MALRDVMQHVVEVEKENAKHHPRSGSNTRLVLLAVACAALLGVSAYSWFARPEFIWGPRRHEDPPQRAVASARTEVFLLSRRLDAYHTAYGKYPANLAVFGKGGADAGITYTLVSDNLYRLTAHSPTGDVTYQSDQPPDQFIGNSLRVLGGTRLQR
jgi:hypothetical protein